MATQLRPADDVRIGVLLPAARSLLGDDGDAQHLVDLAVTAERLGFGAIWVGDSLRAAMVEPLTLLAGITMVTERIALGTAALIPAFRQPVQAAQSIASLDLLSRGRLVLGVGAGFPGWADPEFAVVGIPMRRRSERLDEMVGLWRQLWTASGPSWYHGKLVHVDGLLDPLPPHQPGGPPIWLAAGNAVAQKRAGRYYDGWIPYPPAPEDYAAGLGVVSAAARWHGRDPAAITAALYVTIAWAQTVEAGRKLLDDFCLALYGLPRERVGRNQVLIAGPANHVAAELDRYFAAGARHVIVRLAALDPPSKLEQLHRAAEALLPVRPGLEPRATGSRR